ncbi:hypothetical protein [Labrys wisconsinensis]|uniref:Uncharacterized protein n=1 Tax=Labrys wisconsinensis TaxID=425677 RepID=A0ABU0JM63_9HYPH|nr:hypothetical protein [Labrys wisconsinensis]MDQ0474344.1 hypothetical protein [Labrys wisconsinensis]
MRWDGAPRQVAAPSVAATAGWIAAVTLATAAFSLVLACATPFPALAALAGTRMAPRPAAGLVLASWLANQAIGFTLLGYPLTANAFGWGVAMVLAALLATAAALWTQRLPAATWLVTSAAFALAFVLYEAALLAATVPLASGPEAFSAPVVAWVLWINLVALTGLLALHRLATMAGLRIDRERPALAGAGA